MCDIFFLTQKRKISLIEKIQDYSAKADFDAKFVGQELNNFQQSEKIKNVDEPIGFDFSKVNDKQTVQNQNDMDGWEISFEVRDN